MASVMGMWGDGAEKWKCWFFIGFITTFWRVKRARRTPGVQRDGREVPPENETTRGFFIIGASCRSSELCFLLRRGAHFHKNHESMSPKNEKCCPNHVRYIKILQKWGRMHQDVMKIVSDASLKSAKEATCSNNTHICKVFWGAACGAWSGWKGKRANDKAIRPKNMTNTGSI